MIQLSLPTLMAPEALALLVALNTDDAQTRMVGGCVRDALLGKIPTDIDFATTLPPDVTMNRLHAINIKAIPTGFAHGTVTAVLSEGTTIEITTLRVDVTTHGRHADVVFGRDWRADAARRDFTINSLYADHTGIVTDFFNGLADLFHSGGPLVRFVGNASARVKEDYLRILRFFRFVARFQPETLALDADAIAACRQGISGLHRLSGERIQQEMKKFLSLPRIGRCLDIMNDIGLLDCLGLHSNHCTILQNQDPMLRLACLSWGSDKATLAARWKLSNADIKILHRYHHALMTLGSSPTPRDSAAAVFADPTLPWKNIKALHQALYRHKNLPYISYKPLPISAKTLIDNGIPEGKTLGIALKKAVHYWIDSVFTATPESVLCAAKEDV